MIGGNDFIICANVIEVLAEFGREWPNLVVEAEPPNDLFVYRDVAARDEWNTHGMTETSDDAMIHVIARDDSQLLTLVVSDRKGSTTRSIAERLCSERNHGLVAGAIWKHPQGGRDDLFRPMCVERVGAEGIVLMVDADSGRPAGAWRIEELEQAGWYPAPPEEGKQR